jgi:hypothetical protein
MIMPEVSLGKIEEKYVRKMCAIVNGERVETV